MITAVAICVCGAFITGSVAFVIKSLINDIKQAESSAEKGLEFIRSEIFGLRKSLDGLRTEGRRNEDDMKRAIDLTKVEFREESRSERQNVELVKKEIKQEIEAYRKQTESVLEARRQDVYIIYEKLNQLKDYINERFENLN